MKEAIGSLGIVLVCGTVLFDKWLDFPGYVFSLMLIVGLCLLIYDLHGVYQTWKSRKNN